MADYVSALTGPEMDEALYDMASHTSEAWAVGTRNGTPVSSGDVTYNNSSKYWANRSSAYNTNAQAAAARAESAVPAGTAGAVFFDTAQSLTDAQKGQARTNIGAGTKSTNLLDNPWWGSGEVVNQRGTTSGTAPSFVYTIDRWKMTYSGTAGTYSIGTTGMVFTVPSGSYIQLIQNFNNVVFLNGKTLTASVLLSNGDVYHGTITRTNGTAQIMVNTNSVGVVMQTDNSFRVTVYSNLAIRAVKLELGANSTLSNDVPPNYAEELAKCRYYFRRIAPASASQIFMAFAMSATTATVMNAGFSQPMRATPTATFSGTVNAYNGSNHAVTAISVAAAGDQFNLSFTTSGLTAYTAVTLSLSGYIDLSADL